VKPRWTWERHGLEWRFLSPAGELAATVEPGAGPPRDNPDAELADWIADGERFGWYWSAWDPRGGGGENSMEPRLEDAKWCADRAARVWWYEEGWARLKAGGL
jgi:hypothetical protein